MGALTVALGLPSLLLLQPQRYCHFTQWIPRRMSHKAHSYSHNSLVFSKPVQRRRIGPACSASVSWPYGSEGPHSDRGFLEQEGGLEVLAMGLGVAVSVALAVSKRSAAGVSVGILFLAATTVPLRQQLASLLRLLVAHFNSVQAAMAVQLSTIRNNVIIWGTSYVSSPTAPIESALFPGRQENRQDEMNSSAGSKGLSSAEIEAALSNIAKSVAQLTMVVANLDNKISTLEKDASNNVASFKTPTSEVSPKNMEDVMTDPDVEKRQKGTYRVRNMVANGSVTQLKWEEAVVKDRRANQGEPQGFEPSEEESLASNRDDLFSISEYGSKTLPSTVLYDSRGDRVLLLESSPVDVTNGVGSIWEIPAPSKFSKAQAGDSTMELFFQDVGARTPQEADQNQSKQENAAVEAMEFFFQDAGFKAPETDGQYGVQPEQEVSTAMNSVAQLELSTSAMDSQVPSGAQDNTVKKAAPRSGRIYNDAQREETREAIDRSELDGSEGYRAVPTTVGTGSKPDTLRLKRIMSGAEPFTVEATPRRQSNAYDSMVSETSGSKVLYKETPVLEVAGWDEFYTDSGSIGNNRSDEYGGVSDRAVVGRGATRPQIVVQDVLSYDGQEQSPRGRARPEGSEGIKSSSKSDYGQRWPREGSSDATDAEFGGNGSSSDTNEGENGNKRRQGSSRSSGIENDSDREVEPRTSQDRRPSRASPSYPSERTETFRNLPEPNSDDEGFQKILDEVEALLKEGREGLEGRIEVGVAERMLYEAAELCEKAVEVRPSSLIAVGLWGNTLLLHGELKLRLSQNLRSMLPEPPSKSLNRREFKEAEEERLSLESTLQDVGEECEQLLVEAGRKYRLALSMDRTDMRALYNWGLALCYRGQLIAEEGGETAAQDADKVFLAAIDKFEAMIGLSDTYAAGALLNWGLAMRDRSRLRPLGSKERQKILGQAKEIFQEALRLDPNYGQARGAVAACIVELKGLQEYEEEPKKPKDPSTSRGFRDWWG